MINEVALPAEFKEVMREKILSMFMGLIPQEKIDELVAKEIRVFFETEVMLTVKETTVVVDNPDYNTTTSSYRSERKLTKDAIVFGSNMTPFRQLVWSVVHEYLKPKIKEMISDVSEEAGKELQNQLIEQFKPQVGETFKAIFTQTATSMSAGLFYRQMQYSLQTSHSNMVAALSVVGVPVSNIPNTPFISSPPITL
jgi:hypothetical protein